jgi:hypothetical protein
MLVAGDSAGHLVSRPQAYDAPRPAEASEHAQQPGARVKLHNQRTFTLRVVMQFVVGSLALVLMVLIVRTVMDATEHGEHRTNLITPDAGRETVRKQSTNFSSTVSIATFTKGAALALHSQRGAATEPGGRQICLCS